jgi:hypothetical protein
VEPVRLARLLATVCIGRAVRNVSEDAVGVAEHYDGPTLAVVRARSQRCASWARSSASRRWTATNAPTPRVHVLDVAGEHEQAREWYQSAARHALSVPGSRYLESRAAPKSADWCPES